MARPRAASPWSPVSDAGIASPTIVNGRISCAASCALSCAAAAAISAHKAAASRSRISRCRSRIVGPDMKAGDLMAAGTRLCEIDLLVLEREVADALAGRGKIRVEHGG